MPYRNYEDQKAQARRWYAANRERARGNHQLYYSKNKTKMMAKMREYVAADRPRWRAYMRKYAKENRSKWNVEMRKRRIRIKGCVGTHTALEWDALCAFYSYTCLCCRKTEPEIHLHADHVIPVSRGGSNDIGNIQPLCETCNKSKGTKDTDYRGLVFLLPHNVPTAIRIPAGPST